MKKENVFPINFQEILILLYSENMELLQDYIVRNLNASNNLSELFRYCNVHNVKVCVAATNKLKYWKVLLRIRRMIRTASIQMPRKEEKELLRLFA